MLFAICEDSDSTPFRMLKNLGFVWKKNSMNINSLNRFLAAQEKTYEIALTEIKGGKKRTHWMWYIFPQLRGLGMSSVAHTYGISGLDEAKAYLAHPVLSERIYELCVALLEHKDKSAYDIFGEIDEMKLKSSMTLFALVSEDDSVFHQVLEAFYKGEQDKATLNLLNH